MLCIRPAALANAITHLAGDRADRGGGLRGLKSLRHRQPSSTRSCLKDSRTPTRACSHRCPRKSCRWAHLKSSTGSSPVGPLEDLRMQLVRLCARIPLAGRNRRRNGICQMGTNVKHRESYDLDAISHAVPIPFGTRVGNMLFSSGIMGMDRMSGSLPTDLETQVHHSFLNMRALLEKAGGTLDDVAHVRVLVRLEEYRGAVNAEWVRHSRILKAARLDTPKCLRCAVIC